MTYEKRIKNVKENLRQAANLKQSAEEKIKKIEEEISTLQKQLEWYKEEKRCADHSCNDMEAELAALKMQAAADQFCRIFIVKSRHCCKIYKNEIMTRFVQIYGHNIIDINNSKQTKRFWLRVTASLGKPKDHQYYEGWSIK